MQKIITKIKNQSIIPVAVFHVHSNYTDLELVAILQLLLIALIISHTSYGNGIPNIT
jgi:hypothetical protein